MHETIRWAVVCAVLVLGCGKNRPTAPHAAAPRQTVAVADEANVAEGVDPTTARRIALATPSGNAEVDHVIDGARRALERNPEKVDWWIVLGRGWVRKARESTDPGYHVNASACADVALGIEPDNKLALHLRAVVLLNAHQFERARAIADRLLARDPDDPHAYGVLSDALLELGLYDEAMQAAQRMVDLKPNLASYGRASHLQWLRGDVKAARESVRLAIDSGRDRRDPEPEAWTLVQAAMMFWHLGDYEGADAGFDTALSWMPEYPPALVGKGRVALARGDAERAALLLARAHAASPLVETAKLLGDARATLGDVRGAEEAYASVEKHGRASDPRGFATFLATKGRNAELALELARREHEVRRDIYTEDVLAWALYRVGRVSEAKAAIERAGRLGTRDPALLYHQGAIEIAAGHRKRGRMLVAEALALNPAFDVTGAHEARELLTQTERR